MTDGYFVITISVTIDVAIFLVDFCEGHSFYTRTSPIFTHHRHDHARLIRRLQLETFTHPC